MSTRWYGDWQIQDMKMRVRTEEDEHGFSDYRQRQDIEGAIAKAVPSLNRMQWI